MLITPDTPHALDPPVGLALTAGAYLEQLAGGINHPGPAGDFGRRCPSQHRSDHTSQRRCLCIWAICPQQPPLGLGMVSPYAEEILESSSLIIKFAT